MRKDGEGWRARAWLLYVPAFGLATYACSRSLPLLFRRLMFPGVLEHQESYTVFLLHRMAESPGNLYDMPSLTTGSVIYNPAYYFYMWALRPLVGYNLAAIRIASVVPPLLACGVLVEIIGRRRMALRGLGLVWGCVTLTFYPAATWIDLARLEPLLLFSIVLVWFTLCMDDAWRPKFALVGLAVSFSFAVKQPGALLIAAPLVLSVLDRRYLISAAVALAAIAAFAGAMYLCYGESYIYWTITQPGTHNFFPRLAILRLGEIVRLAPILLIGPMFLVLRGCNVCSPEGKLLLVTAGTFVICVMGAGKVGGGSAQYIVILYLSAIGAAVVILKSLSLADLGGLRFGLSSLVVLAYSLAMIRATEQDRTGWPRREDRQQQAAVLDVVQSVDGESWVTTWPHIDLWAGNPPKNSLVNLVAGSGDVASQSEFDAPAPDCEGAIRDRRFALVITTHEFVPPFQELLDRHYLYCGSLPMRHFGHRLFPPTEVWARSHEVRAQVLKVFDKRGIESGPQIRRTGDATPQ